MSRPLLLTTILSLAVSSVFAAEISKPIPLWPGDAPGEKGGFGPEADQTKPTDKPVGGRPLIRLGNVSQPTLTIYTPDKNRTTGAAIIVCPGGGYSILALDLEGTEICEWLNSIGVTAVLLKYRVPKRPGLEKHTAALQDAQRAVGLVRSRATEFGIDPKRIGILGFSAGGHLAATASTNYETRTYPAIDDADQQSCRPDFAVLVYPAYLTLKDKNDELAPELKITAQTPQTFMVMAQDDPIRVEGPIFYSLALKKEKVPFELHTYPTGGHGYGLRPSEHNVTSWPARVADWLRTRGLLQTK